MFGLAYIISVTKIAKKSIPLKQPVYKIPDEESDEFSDQKKNHCPERAGFVEAESNGNYITYERDPGCQCKPDSIAVHFFLLPGKCLRTYLEPFLNPFPFADPTDPVGGNAAQPIAYRAYDQTAG